jgi:pyocin large subunit-like protein
MMRVHSLVLVSAALAGVLAASGCGREADKAARVETPYAPAQASNNEGRSARANYQQRSYDRGDDGARDRGAATRRFEDGKALWASSRQRSGEDNAQRQFDRNGAAFKARSLDDYVAKAHAFVAAPPKGVLKASRSNGDVLYYDPKGNVFLVADRQGAPRTMFKPDDGMSYWTEQTQRLATQRTTGRQRDRSRAPGEDSNG